LSDGLLGKSCGQVCPVNQGCGNTLGTDAHYGTVGGGTGHNVNGYAGTVDGGFTNTATATYDTVSGGRANTASGDFATIGGGYQNQVSGFYATVSGGNVNQASGERSSVGGGHGNRALGSHAAVGGGRINLASGPYATVSGGYANAATNVMSWAGGRRAKARHQGAYVWADSTNADFASTTANQFNVRAKGGTRIFSNAAATVGVRLLPGSNAWSIASDRALKDDFHDIDKQQILAEVRQLRIQNWKLKEEEGDVRHVGPVAQEFHAAFGLGNDERYIHSGDALGVALAAIQALAERVQALEKQNHVLLRRLEATAQNPSVP